MPKTLTTDEWVAKLNKIGGELDERCSSLHPSAWQYDPDIAKLKERYRALAKRETEDRVQLSF